MRKKCPNCNDIIEKLLLEQRGIEYISRSFVSNGSCNLNGDDKNIDDTNSDFDNENYGDSEINEIIYKCPSCEEEVCIEDLILIDELEENELKIKQNNIAINTQKPDPIKMQDALEKDFIIGKPHKNGLYFVICKNCDTITELQTENDNVFYTEITIKNTYGKKYCPKCNKILNEKNIKQLINV